MPADGALLVRAPADVRVVFDDTVRVGSGNAAVANRSRRSVLAAPAHARGRVLTLPLVAGLTRGDLHRSLERRRRGRAPRAGPDRVRRRPVGTAAGAGARGLDARRDEEHRPPRAVLPGAADRRRCDRLRAARAPAARCAATTAARRAALRRAARGVPRRKRPRSRRDRRDALRDRARHCGRRLARRRGSRRARARRPGLAHGRGRVCARAHGGSGTRRARARPRPAARARSAARRGAHGGCSGVAGRPRRGAVAPPPLLTRQLGTASRAAPVLLGGSGRRRAHRRDGAGASAHRARRDRRALVDVLRSCAAREDRALRAAARRRPPEPLAPRGAVAATRAVDRRRDRRDHRDRGRRRGA